MVLQKVRVSQNFGQILRVSQCHFFFSGYVRLAVSIFFLKPSQSLDFFFVRVRESQSKSRFVCLFLKTLTSSRHLISNYK